MSYVPSYPPIEGPTKECPECKGSGRRSSDNALDDCNWCDGTGDVPCEVDDVLILHIEALEQVLRELASYLGAGGFNADEVDPLVYKEKIMWGIHELEDQIIKLRAYQEMGV
jgi:hypothetical protein